MKKILFSLLIFTAFLIGGWWINSFRSFGPSAVLNKVNFLKSNKVNSANVNSPASALKVIFFDIGQGDSALILTPQGKKILVDGGPDDKVLSKLGKYLPLRDKKIDVMILTHPHADHLEGLISVLRRYEVGEVYYSGMIHTTAGFLEWLKLIKEKDISMKIIKKRETVEIGGVNLDFLYPDRDLSLGAVSSAAGTAGGNGATDISDSEQESKYKSNGNLNNTSVVFKLSFGRTSFLFMGDAEKEVEEILLKKCGDNINDNIKEEALNKVKTENGDCFLKADVLKAGHHGSHTSSGEEFLRAVKPKQAIISVGKDNDYGHPHLRVLRRLERLGIKILRTDEIGDIEMMSDGMIIK